MIKIAYIKWVDAHGGDGQYGLSFAQGRQIDEMESAGILISDDDEQITIAQDWFELKGRETQVRNYESIPKTNIKSFRIWEPEEAK